MKTTNNTSKLAPLGHNPVLVAQCLRSYRAAVKREEDAPTTEAAWRLASATQRALRDLQAAQLGQPLPSVVARMARAAKTAARRALAALSTIGKVIARAMTRAAALTRRSIASTLAAALNLTTEGKDMTKTSSIYTVVGISRVATLGGAQWMFRYRYTRRGEGGRIAMHVARLANTEIDARNALAELEADFGRADERQDIAAQPFAVNFDCGAAAGNF